MVGCRSETTTSESASSCQSVDSGTCWSRRSAPSASNAVSWSSISKRGDAAPPSTSRARGYRCRSSREGFQKLRDAPREVQVPKAADHRETVRGNAALPHGWVAPGRHRHAPDRSLVAGLTRPPLDVRGMDDERHCVAQDLSGEGELLGPVLPERRDQTVHDALREEASFRSGLPLHRLEIPLRVAAAQRDPCDQVVEHELVQHDHPRPAAERVHDPVVGVGVVARRGTGRGRRGEVVAGLHGARREGRPAARGQAPAERCSPRSPSAPARAESNTRPSWRGRRRRLGAPLSAALERTQAFLDLRAADAPPRPARTGGPRVRGRRPTARPAREARPARVGEGASANGRFIDSGTPARNRQTRTEMRARSRPSPRGGGEGGGGGGTLAASAPSSRRRRSASAS